MIPILDLAAPPRALAAELRRINETVGFMTIVNHGVDQALIDATFAMAARFHALPMDTKLALKIDESFQGYLPYKASTARANGLVAIRKPNENEAFFVNPERDPARPANRWPAALPEFGPTTLRYFAAVEDLAQRLLPLYAMALDLPEGFFSERCTTPLSMLRLTHYPPVEYGADEYGIAPHTDSSFITLLAQNPTPGLQLRTTEGAWIDVPPIPGSFVVNTGDVLGRWTNGRFLSTPHRAFNLTGAARYAIPFFFHPNLETRMDCLPGCSGPDNPMRFPEQTVAEYWAWFRGSNYDPLREKKAG